MCGHQFEKAGNNAQVPAPDDAQQKSRVRQRTGSASATEVDAIKTQTGSGTHSVGGSASNNPIPPANSAFGVSSPSAATSKFSTPQSSPRDTASPRDAASQEEFGSKLSSWKQFVSTGDPIADEDIDTTFLDEEPKKEKDRLPTGVLSREKLMADSSFESDADIVDAFAWDDAEDNEEDEDFEGEAEPEGDALGSSDAAPQGRKRRRRRRRRKGNATNEQASAGASGPQVPPPQPPLSESVVSGAAVSSSGSDRSGAKEIPAAGSASAAPSLMRSAFASSAPADSSRADSARADSPKMEVKAPASAPAPAEPPPPAAPVVSTTAAPASVEAPVGTSASTPPTKSFVAQSQGAIPIVSETVPPSTQPVKKSETSEVPKSVGAQVESPRPEVARVTPNHVMGEGMLVGWLVTFKEDQKGKAIEIREGRRFIGRGHLRPTDVVFDHESVSTPHGMLAAAPGDGLMFQDLMSEKGTFILRAGGKVSDWSQVVNSVSLQHGDRLRFGDYEVLVVLLPR